MFGSNILETAIGIILVFLIMSLLCSAVRELIETMLKQRALDLERGIRALLQDADGDGLACELYSHPLVFGLYRGDYTPRNATSRIKRWFGRGGKLPSYIPAEHFARAIIDLEQQGKIDSPAVRAVIRSLSHESADLGQLRVNLENWFNSSTERIGGWYKRRTQVVLLALGFAAAVALNVNPINMATTLYRDGELRAAVTATAEKVAANTNPNLAADSASVVYSRNLAEMHKLAAAGLPMGWSQKPSGWGWLLALLGWLVTAIAVTLGAPFWFDLLNKFMTLRSTVKPKTKAPEPADETPPPPLANVAQATKQAIVNEVVAAKAMAATAVPALVGAYKANEWRFADEEEGDL